MWKSILKTGRERKKKSRMAIRKYFLLNANAINLRTF